MARIPAPAVITTRHCLALLSDKTLREGVEISLNVRGALDLTKQRFRNAHPRQSAVGIENGRRCPQP